MNAKIGQKYQKGEITERKRAKIENPYLNAHLHINMNSHIYFQKILQAFLRVLRV